MNYDEKAAVALLRKSIKRDPEILVALLKDITKESAHQLLIQASRELEVNLVLARAMSGLAQELVNLNKETT